MPNCLAISARFSAVIAPGRISPPMAKANSGDNPGYSRVHVRS